MYTFSIKKSTLKRLLAIAVVFTFIVMVIIVLTFAIPKFSSNADDDYDYFENIQGEGAIASNGVECAGIGQDIFKKGGSAADAAIAVLLCEGLSNPHSMGIGGGFVATIFIKENGFVETLNARERAPLAATEDMFVNNPIASQSGGLSVAVPGEIKGYWELHQKYGKLKWSEIIQPAIGLCENGHRVSNYLARVLQKEQVMIKENPSISEIFINSDTKNVWMEGDKIKRPILAETLRTIAEKGAAELYNGTLTNILIGDIQNMGGIITRDDFLLYRVKWDRPVQTKFLKNYTVYSTPLPSSGSVLIFILNILDQFLDSVPSILNYHRIVEAFKYAYAQRSALGDIDYEPTAKQVFEKIVDPNFAHEIRLKINDNQTSNSFKHYGGQYSSTEDHGTSHISILAPNGDAIAVTSTINSYFGSKNRSTRTGIILNNQMDDFSTPNLVNYYNISPSPVNFIKPGKQPMSSMTPTIIINDNRGSVDMIIGSAGGSKITTIVAYVILRHHIFGENLKKSVNAPRIHHQLMPMVLGYEKDFDDKMVEGLRLKGHKVLQLPKDGGFSAITAVAREVHYYSSVVDPRRGGNTVVF